MEPYPKPIILNHDLNSEAIGRVMAARMDKEQDGSSFIRLQIAITDPVAIQKVLDKRYLTGSVGGRAGKAVCSITGDDLASESAGKPPATRYKRGQVYKGKLSYIDMQDISFKEYSFVNQPADSKSSVRTIKPVGSDSVETSDSEWVAKSSAFILSMDEENIYSLEENESIFIKMKKKESTPLYLHLKGAFLTAMAVHESENYNNSDASLLYNQNESNNTHGENQKMKDNVQQDDVLAAVEGLSNDLSAIASSLVEGSQEDADVETAPETEEVVEETPATEAPEAEELLKTEEDKQEEVTEEEVADIKDLEDQASDALKKANEKIAQLEAQIAKDPSIAQAYDGQESEEVSKSAEELIVVDSANSETSKENQEEEVTKAELTSTQSAPEQKAEESNKKVQLLEEENRKLKNALHRTLAERVVDTKIAAGVEPAEVREDLIEEHVKRSASSLADSLRDLAKMPIERNSKNALPEINSEVEAVEGENNVLTVGKQEVEEEVKEEALTEQVFVDALMGRRKL